MFDKSTCVVSLVNSTSHIGHFLPRGFLKKWTCYILEEYHNHNINERYFPLFLYEHICGSDSIEIRMNKEGFP